MYFALSDRVLINTFPPFFVAALDSLIRPEVGAVPFETLILFPESNVPNALAFNSFKANVLSPSFKLYQPVSCTCCPSVILNASLYSPLVAISFVKDFQVLSPLFLPPQVNNEVRFFVSSL